LNIFADVLQKSDAVVEPRAVIVEGILGQLTLFNQDLLMEAKASPQIGEGYR
jgi:hypothetical protein